MFLVISPRPMEAVPLLVQLYDFFMDFHLPFRKDDVFYDE